MNRWKGLLLGTLAMLLVSAPPAEAAKTDDAAVRAETVDAKTLRDAERAAKAAARAERQAARAAAKAERMNAIAAEKAAAAAKVSHGTPAAPQDAVKAERILPAAAQSNARDAAKAARQEEIAAANAEKKAARAEKRAQDRRDRHSRYKTLFVDNGFTYYLDVQNTRWVPRPYNTEEYMIDVWVRLVENIAGVPAEDGKLRPAKYFLEHYYISPKRREIMFIAELEIAGRPENAVKERAYDPTQWEKLVPGSIEDALYEAVTARMKSAPGQRRGLLSGTSGMSLRDMIEEFARVSF